MLPTLNLRQVWRHVSDGNDTYRTLILQQWHKMEGYEHPYSLKKGGIWEDVEISTTEPEEGP